MREKVAVVLTCYNRKDKTVNCIKSLADKNPNLDFRFVVVDDESTDGTGAALKDLPYHIKRIEGDGKLFWTGGMYLGMDYVLMQADKIDYVLLVNDDVEFYDNAVINMINSLKAVCSDVVVGATKDSQNKMSYGGVRMTSRRLARFELMEPGTADQCDTFNCNAVLLKRDAFVLAGNLDQKYTHSMADYDYGIHLRKIGLIVIECPQYVGFCEDNADEGTWRDTTLKRGQRLKLKESPKGLPFKDWFHFINKNYGFISAIYHTITPYVRILIGK